MRTIPTAIAPDTFTGLVGGDRTALHQLFNEFARVKQIWVKSQMVVVDAPPATLKPKK